MVTMLGENADNQAPNSDDLVSWATEHGLTHSLVADPGFTVNALWWPDTVRTVPHTMLIGTDVRISAVEVSPLDTAAVEAVLP